MCDLLAIHKTFLAILYSLLPTSFSLSYFLCSSAVMCVQRLVLAVGLWVFTTKQHDSSHIQSARTRAHSSKKHLLTFSAFYKRVTWQICLLLPFNELPEHSPNTASPHTTTAAWHLLCCCLSGQARSDYPAVRVPCQKINLFQISRPKCAQT